MQIDNDFESYIINEAVPISEALSKLNEQKHKILFVVSTYNVVIGAFADGDFRRWVISSKSIDLTTPVKKVANKSFTYAFDRASEVELAELFSERITVLPLLDDEFRITGVAKPGKKTFSIGSFNLNEKAKSLIIAEIGNNHNGSIDEAKRLVNSAIASGANCVKFQMRDLDTLYINQGTPNDPSADLGTQYVLDLLSKFQLSDNGFKELFEYCHNLSIPVLCTPFDIVSADKLEKLNVEAYKVASADLTNHELLIHLCSKNKPLIVSTGMSTEEEIISAIKLLRSKNANFVILHCNSTYPCPFEDVNLKYLKRLRELSGGIVGYSGHERGEKVAVAAVALGAKIIEKHFTHDRNQEGNDHKVSLLPVEFKRMVQGIREVESSLGSAEIRKITQGEMINRETLGKSIIATRSIRKGEVIHDSMLTIMSPGKGLAPCYKKDLIGRIANRDIGRNDFFYPSDLSHQVIKPRNYKFNNRFGLPTRYHDFESIIRNSNLDFVEFHLSYNDLDINVDTFFSKPFYNLDCLVHAPELFASDHLLDLCSQNERYRQQSLLEMQRVIDTANHLKSYFKNKNDKVLIVVNVGGFSKDGFLSENERTLSIDTLEKSLRELNKEGVELIPQTMPPYPWHFGGQQHHNIFVDPDEIVAWCKKTGMRICLDVSHTALACNHSEIPFIEAIEKLATHTAHIHIADAEGTKQEGLQIGEGNIDFEDVFKVVENKMKNAYWLPEIWQGHKNNGEGFWLALDRLENIIRN